MDKNYNCVFNDVDEYTLRLTHKDGGKIKHTSSVEIAQRFMTRASDGAETFVVGVQNARGNSKQIRGVSGEFLAANP